METNVDTDAPGSSVNPRPAKKSRMETDVAITRKNIAKLFEGLVADCILASAPVCH
jgi:hypothetical protein